MKKNIDVARAWRDEDYFLSLSQEDRASLGIHPAGAQLMDEALMSITGGCCSMEICFSCEGTALCTPCPPRECY